ncbi:MAG TPA: glutamate formimidoyltransferase [Actinomycetota bacterium]|nr:glutamate formimidoyltransferase [Actinomycetota bacterium]
MPLLAIPNVSEGRSQEAIDGYAHAVVEHGARILDIHSDRAHNRSVFTITGEAMALVDAMVELAREASSIDLTEHDGVHPRLGGLDVCPIVPLHEEMSEAVMVARAIGTRIGTEVGLPVYLYGEAATRSESKELPDIRRGGLAGVIKRAAEGSGPDRGASVPDATRGVVCVGARGPLIAFNVWLNCSAQEAAAIASEIRGAEDLPGVRALGFAIAADSLSQVSMNLVTPEVTGIDAVFERVAELAATAGITIRGSEIVGLLEARFLPDPERAAARALISPGRSLDAVLKS